MKNSQKIGLLLTPSWVVSVVGGSLAALLSGAAMVLSQFQYSQLRQEIFDINSQAAASGAQSTYQTVANNLAANQFLNTLPLFLIWAGLGLIVYFFAVAVVGGVNDAVELEEELDYVHTSKRRLLLQELQRLAVRALAMVGWFGFVHLTIKYVLAYVLATANLAANNFNLVGLGYLALSVTVVFVDVWIQAIFLRLVALKPRLFSETY